MSVPFRFRVFDVTARFFLFYPKFCNSTTMEVMTDGRLQPRRSVTTTSTMIADVLWLLEGKHNNNNNNKCFIICNYNKINIISTLAQWVKWIICYGKFFNIWTRRAGDPTYVRPDPTITFERNEWLKMGYIRSTVEKCYVLTWSFWYLSHKV